MFKRIAFFFAVITFLLPGNFCFSQGEEGSRQIQSVTGSIVSTEWVGDIICVRWLQAEGIIGYDNLTISVPDGLKINKGTDIVTLANLNIGDNVTVKYYNDNFAGLKAVSLTVNR